MSRLQTQVLPKIIITFMLICFFLTPRVSLAGDFKITSSKLDYLQVTVPEYPKLARKKGWEGTTLIKALVSENGVPVQTVVEKSSGHPMLDNSAKEAVKQWKFYPAQYENVSYASLVLIPVQFVLSESDLQ